MPIQTDGYPILLSLLLRQDCYEQIRKHSKRFEVLARTSDVLTIYWHYCEEFREAPVNRKALEEFAVQQPTVTLEQLAPELDTAEGIDPAQVTDFNAAFHHAWEEARVAYMQHIASSIGAIAIGRSSKSLDRRYVELYGEDESKWDRVAMAAVVTREKLANNPFADQEDVTGGTYQENTERVRERILEAFAEEDDNGALLTGFPTIDANVTVGTGFQHLRLVGIAGQSGRGKTLILLTLAYNLARQGKNVLYNSLEHGYEDTWALMAFLHASYFSDQGRFTIPPLNPENLDSAILRRPGRFDRVVPFLAPSPKLRREYLMKITGGRLCTAKLDSVVALSDGFSFAQLREGYILAGQVAFERNDEEMLEEDLLDGVKRVRTGVNGADGRLGERGTGFAPLSNAAQA